MPVPRLISKSRLRLRSESGQSSVEFALLIIPLVIFIIGIVEFSFFFQRWLDQTHLSSTGARYAAVANVPDGATLTDFLKGRASTAALRNGMSVAICYPDGA